MKLTLRKANAIQNSIRDVIKTISLSTTVSVNEFQDAAAVVVAASSTLAANVERQSKLLDALFEIRAKVSEQNANSGVDAELTKQALIDKKIAMFSDVASGTVQTDVTILQGHIEKIKNQQQNAIYGNRLSEIQTSALSDQQKQEYTKMAQTLKKEKQASNDKVLALNVSVEIELTQDTADLLTAEGIL